MNSGNYLNGEFKPAATGDGEIVRYNPANSDDLVARFVFSRAAAHEAAAAAHQAFPAWAQLTGGERWAHLNRLAACIKADEKMLAATLSREIGKPLWEAQQELQTVHGKFQVTQNEAMKLVQDFSTAMPNPALKALCHFKPRGALAVIAPFNFPLHLALGHIIPALACGNTVVLKPSELAPQTSFQLAQTVHKANLPAGVFNLVQGDHTVGAALCTSTDIHGVLFTGSYAVGRKITERLADLPEKIIALEMGGKNASLIWSDADLAHACRQAAVSATVTTAQRCTCTSKLLVHRSILPKVTERIVALMKQLKIGEPSAPGIYMGPLVSQAAQKKFTDAQHAAKDAGAKVLLAPECRDFPKGSCFVTPSVHLVENVDMNSPYFDTEFFSPDLAIYPVDDFDQAVAMIEKSRYGLAAAIYTQNRSLYERFFNSVTAGFINWNRPTTGAPSGLPFGGQKASGNDFPTALFAPYYCTYPAGSVTDEKAVVLETYPGFPEHQGNS